MRSARSSLPALLLALVQTGCLSAYYRRDTRFEPPPAGAVAALAPERSDLGECLQRLGAPLWVWERQGSGAALAWGWLESGDWNLSLRFPIANNTSGSFTWREIDARMRGVVLFFDADWRLESIRKGQLRDLTVRFQGRRPAFESEP